MLVDVRAWPSSGGGDFALFGVRGGEGRGWGGGGKRRSTVVSNHPIKAPTTDARWIRGETWGRGQETYLSVGHGGTPPAKKVKDALRTRVLAQPPHRLAGPRCPGKT